MVTLKSNSKEIILKKIIRKAQAPRKVITYLSNHHILDLYNQTGEIGREIGLILCGMLICD